MLLALAEYVSANGRGETPSLDQLARVCRLPDRNAAYRVFENLVELGEIAAPRSGKFDFFVMPGVASLAEPSSRPPRTAPVKPEPPSGQVVYLIGSPGSSLVKIGRSDDVARRFLAIQSMSPLPLTVMWSTPGGADLEMFLHRAFARRRRHGEWFDFGTTDPIAAISGVLERHKERAGT